MVITEIRVATCDIPLSNPVMLGEIRYDSRDYVLVEITTDDAVSGVSFGLARHSPVARIIERNLAPLILGRDPLDTDGLWDRMYSTNMLIGQQGIFMRALSLVDIALWDLKGQAFGQPLWRILGGAPRPIQTIMAGGYVYPGKTVADLEVELGGYVDRGFRFVKIAAGVVREDTPRVEAARAIIGDGISLAYDGHSAWRTAYELVPTLQRWEDYDLAWIEDPFPGQLTSQVDRLREQVQIPIAMGEDVVGRWAFSELITRGSVDVIRVDATTMGGISEAVRVIAVAGVHGVPVSPHIYHEVHGHLATAFHDIPWVEVTDPAQEIDVYWRVLRSDHEATSGDYIAPSSPGLGIAIDWEAVESLGSRATVKTIRAEDGG